MIENNIERNYANLICIYVIFQQLCWDVDKIKSLDTFRMVIQTNYFSKLSAMNGCYNLPWSRIIFHL